MTLANLWSLLYAAWGLFELFLLLRTRTRANHGSLHDRGSLRLLWITICLSVLAAEFLRNNFETYTQHRTLAFSLVSISIMILGLAIRATAVVTLGRAFSVNVAIRPGQSLYRAGLYRYLRHPSYLGSVLIFLAVGIAMRNPFSFLIMTIPPTVAILHRIRIEESALRLGFGSEYEAYSKQSWRLIPFLY